MILFTTNWFDIKNYKPNNQNCPSNTSKKLVSYLASSSPRPGNKSSIPEKSEGQIIDSSDVKILIDKLNQEINTRNSFYKTHPNYRLGTLINKSNIKTDNIIEAKNYEEARNYLKNMIDFLKTNFNRVSDLNNSGNCSTHIHRNMSDYVNNLRFLGEIITAEKFNALKEMTNNAEIACLCDCNYCTCDCNYCACNRECSCDGYCNCDGHCWTDCGCDNYCSCDNHCRTDCGCDNHKPCSCNGYAPPPCSCHGHCNDNPPPPCSCHGHVAPPPCSCHGHCNNRPCDCHGYGQCNNCADYPPCGCHFVDNSLHPCPEDRICGEDG